METRFINSSNCLFVLTVEDAQFAAKDLLGRELKEEELRSVRKGIEWGLEGWPEVMRSAILNAASVEIDTEDVRDGLANEK